jgi:O-methyltransferase
LLSALSRSLFAARRAFLEPTLDPSRDSVVLPIATYSPWLLDAEFQSVLQQVRANTLVDPLRCWELWFLAGQLAKLRGDYLEVGVWRGGTGALVAKRVASMGIDAEVHLCDTFSGVVKAGDADTHYRSGEHADTSPQLVQELLDRLGLTNAHIHVGVFPDEAPTHLADRLLRFVHIDVDVYESAREIVEWVWPRLVGGGVIVFDDFGFSTTRGITRLCHELEGKSDAILLQNLNGHGVLIKTSA